MNQLDTLLQNATRDVDPVQLDYSDEYPNPEGIANGCGPMDVLEVLSRIEKIAAERNKADESNEVNGDDLDGYWRQMGRYAALLPYLALKHPEEVFSGLRSGCKDTRLLVAYAIKKRPLGNASKPIETALQFEPDELVRRTLGQALVACRSERGLVDRLLRR